MCMEEIAGAVKAAPQLFARGRTRSRENVDLLFHAALSLAHRSEQFAEFLLQPIILDYFVALERCAQLADFRRHRSIMRRVPFEERSRGGAIGRLVEQPLVRPG